MQQLDTQNDVAGLPPAPCTLVIFGAAGDLTKRLLSPALYNLARNKLLPENFALLGVARTDKDADSFRAELTDSMREFSADSVETPEWKGLVARMDYMRGEFDDPHLYADLERRLAESPLGKAGHANYLFYLATPPQGFRTIIQQLGHAGLVREEEGVWRRVIIEKPFGTDLPSAQALNRDILDVLKESQIYRIDHYLGKETVQNLMVFRFGNGIFEPLWNRDHIDHVQITVAETVNVEGRGKFYDATGAMRDMVPNHLCQLLSLTAMEAPSRFDAESVRTEKAKVLDAVTRFGDYDARHNVVRAQYGAGTVGKKPVVGFRGAPDVPGDTTTETFVAMKLMINNWRWAGVPFYVRTGKALAKRRSEIAIQFKQAPLALFRDTPVNKLPPNDLIMHIQPEEGATLRFSAKIPGPTVRIGAVDMKFHYEDYFKAAPRTGYETLIYDCMLGDPTLFQRADTIEAGWRIVQPVMDAWKADGRKDLPTYAAGSGGPVEADALLFRDGRRWRSLEQPA